MTSRTYTFVGQVKAIEAVTVTLPGVGSASNHKLPKNAYGCSYIPGSSFRGYLRHLSHQIALGIHENKMKEEGIEALTLDDHLMLAQGYFVNVEAQKKLNKEASDGLRTVDKDMEIKNKNPIMALWGRWLMGGKVGIGSMITKRPQDTILFGSGARGVMFERNPDLIEELTEDDSDRLFDMLQNHSMISKDNVEIKKDIAELKKQLKTVDGDEKASINAEIRKKEDAIKERKQGNKDGIETLRRPIGSYEAISPNVEMEHRMSLKGASESQLGMFLDTLRLFARHPRLGGHVNHNSGLIHASWDVKTWVNEDDLELTTIGTVTINDDGMSVDGDELKKVFQDWVNLKKNPEFIQSVDFKSY